jgi:flagellin
VGVGNDEEVDRITFDPGDANLTASALGIDDINVQDKEDAQEALTILDNAINKVNNIRARVGSAQNRLLSTMSASGIFQENLLSAKARIRDADIAAESANYARETILRRAGVAVLTQANETPALALQLLKTY